MTNSGVTSNKFSGQDLIDQVQDLDSALAMIEQLKGGMATRGNWEGVFDLVDALVRGVEFPAVFLDENICFYRGRIEKNVENYSNYKEFSYKPKNLSTEYGRCNKPGAEIFYCALNLDTVLAELSPEIGDKIHVGVVKLKKGTKVLLSSIGGLDHMRRYNRKLFDNNNQVNEDQTKFIEGLNVRNLLVDAFFAEAFAKPATKAKEYKLTSALTNSMLYGRGEDGAILCSHKKTKEGSTVLLDGFSYPSVAHSGGINFVIAPESFDVKFDWDRFMVYEIINYIGFGLYGRKLLTSADTWETDGTIDWE